MRERLQKEDRPCNLFMTPDTHPGRAVALAKAGRALPERAQPLDRLGALSLSKRLSWS
jgi:hypothetical protein